jgi:hypothetical protein
VPLCGIETLAASAPKRGETQLCQTRGWVQATLAPLLLQLLSRLVTCGGLQHRLEHRPASQGCECIESRNPSRPTRVQSASPSFSITSASVNTFEMLWIENRLRHSPTP